MSTGALCESVVRTALGVSKNDLPADICLDWQVVCCPVSPTLTRSIIRDTVTAMAYDDADIAGMDEANPCLLRLSTNGWKEATCAGYVIERFPDDNLIAVPVCQTGTFVLSDEALRSFVYLPVVLRSH